MRKFILSFLAFAALAITISAQTILNPLLQAGPMPGYADMREAMLWVQTTRSAEVYAVYADAENSEVLRRTNKVLTNKATAYTAR
ncbi:MAG: alkaline phosphatase family protein, partial [Lentimicrobium sp.]|nr:alkaline phosphatase family protein [Lentimicrobium sp.]